MPKLLEVPDHLVPALERMLAISAKKKNDYSRVGPWQNFHDTSNFFHLRPWQSAIFNCVQKLCRVQSLSDGRQVMNEPLEDTLLDFANYALFAYAMFLDELESEAQHRLEPVNALGMRECCETDPDSDHDVHCEKIF